MQPSWPVATRQYRERQPSRRIKCLCEQSLFRLGNHHIAAIAVALSGF